LTTFVARKRAPKDSSLMLGVNGDAPPLAEAC